VWGAIKPFVDTVLDMFQEFGEWVDENWDDISDNLLETLGEVLGSIVGDLDTVLDNIKDWLLGTDIDTEEMSDWHWLMGIISEVLSGLEQGLSSFRQLVTDIGNIFSWLLGVLGTVANLFIDIFNMGIDAINWALGWLGVDLPHIPRFAEGGIVTGPTALIAGEAGTEVILPLNQLASMMSMQPQAAGMTGFGGLGAGGGVGGSSATININLSQDRLSTIMLRRMTSQNVNDNGVGFAPIRTG